MDENNHVIERNDKADLMTMSTPPHLLSAALMGNGSSPEDGMMDPTKPRRIQYNHRSEYSRFFSVKSISRKKIFQKSFSVKLTFLSLMLFIFGGRKFSYLACYCTVGSNL